VRIALVIPEQNFCFETGALIRVLGKRPSMVVTPAVRSADDEDLHFVFTRRQAEWARQLDQLQRESAESKASARQAGETESDCAVAAL
jgi:hypothetical protein